MADASPRNGPSATVAGQEAAVRPARVISVLGMHRSGTSFLVGSLQQHGLFLGRHRTNSRFNLRGNRENRDIWELQDSVLSDSGGSWDRPPPVVEWKPERLEQARHILAENAGQPIWGFKDPRTLLTLEGWRRLVPDLELVGIFRHPLRVADSLRRRDDMPLEQALGLWEHYNKRLLGVHQERPFPILGFDDEPLALQSKLLEVVTQLGLERASPAEPFFSDELRQADAGEAPLPTAIEALYGQLRAVSI